MEHLSEQIFEALAAKNITYVELAAQLGMSRPTVWRKMKHPEMWRAGELQKLSAILGIDIDIRP